MVIIVLIPTSQKPSFFALCIDVLGLAHLETPLDFNWSKVTNNYSFLLKVMEKKNNVALSPSIVETYSRLITKENIRLTICNILRLLVYSEIESLGIKGFLNQLLPKVGSQIGLNTQMAMFHSFIHHKGEIHFVR